MTRIADPDWCIDKNVGHFIYKPHNTFCNIQMTLFSSHWPQVCHTDTELSLRFTAGAAAGDWGQHLIRREWPGRRGLRSPISLSQRRNHAANTASDPGINEGFMIHQNEWIRESMSVYRYIYSQKETKVFLSLFAIGIYIIYIQK